MSDYVEHMIDAIDAIQSHVAGADRERFRRDRMMRDAVIRNFQVLGDASRLAERADAALVVRETGVPWAVIQAMRHRLVHGYFEIDVDRVWETIVQDLPRLRHSLADLHSRLRQP